MGNKLKKIVYKTDPQTKKTIPGNKDQVARDTPIWSFSIFDQDIALPIGDKETCTFCEIANHLKSYEGRTWGEIVGHAHRDHFIELDHLSRFAQDRLRLIGMYKPDQYPEIFRFRFTGRRRLWGFKDGRMFKALWWDPEHEICP
jgi:hypothetical protein